MAGVQLADLEKRAGWVHVIAKGVSVMYHRASGTVSVGGVEEAGRRYPGGPVSKRRWISRIELARKCRVPVVLVHAIHESCGEDGARGSGHIMVNYDRESSVVMMGLSPAPRGSGAVNTVAASGDPWFAGPTLPLKNAHVLDRAWVEPPINRRGRLSMRWPGIGSRIFVL